MDRVFYSKGDEADCLINELGGIIPPLRHQSDMLPNSFVAIRSLFRAQYGKNRRLRPGLCSGPRWGAYSALPDPLVGLRVPTFNGG